MADYGIITDLLVTLYESEDNICATLLIPLSSNSSAQ